MKCFKYSAQKLSIIILIAFGLSGCGSSSGSSDNESPENIAITNDLSNLIWERGVYPDPDILKDYCEIPRNSDEYDDKDGSYFLEKMWLRSWSEDVYLWYRELSDVDVNLYDTPLEYFATRKTDAITPSGIAKDQFHFSVNTQENNERVSSGSSVSYGMTFKLLSTSPPRQAVVIYVEPDSPAADAGITRGAEIISVDGVDLANGNDTTTLNNGLFPDAEDASHSFGILDLDSTASRTVTLNAEVIEENPVLNTKVITNDTGENTGYLTFNTFGTFTAEEALVDAFSYLSDEGVSDLVIDLRYNGGGFLAISSQLAYMIAGPTNTADRIYYQTQYNDKYSTTNPTTGLVIQPYPFIDTGLNFTVSAEEELPTLNLDRVFVITTDSTCSASEAVMNGLDGIGVEVIQIGGKTCGKPYGFVGTDNCGTTYFTIMFQGVNAEGFGDYADGFYAENANVIGSTILPGCEVEDDYSHLLGDEEENMLSAALQYKDTGTCPTQFISAARSFIEIENTDPNLDLLNDERVHSKMMLDTMLLIND